MGASLQGSLNRPRETPQEATTLTVTEGSQHQRARKNFLCHRRHDDLFELKAKVV